MYAAHRALVPSMLCWGLCLILWPVTGHAEATILEENTFLKKVDDLMEKKAIDANRFPGVKARKETLVTRRDTQGNRILQNGSPDDLRVQATHENRLAVAKWLAKLEAKLDFADKGKTPLKERELKYLKQIDEGLKSGSSLAVSIPLPRLSALGVTKEAGQLGRSNCVSRAFCVSKQLGTKEVKTLTDEGKATRYLGKLLLNPTKYGFALVNGSKLLAKDNKESLQPGDVVLTMKQAMNTKNWRPYHAAVHMYLGRTFYQQRDFKSGGAEVVGSSRAVTAGPRVKGALDNPGRYKVVVLRPLRPYGR